MSTFLERLRNKSAYPVFRVVTTVFQVIGYVAAVVIAIVGFTSGKLIIIVGALAAAAVFAVMVRLFTEMSLMIADMADAVIQSAETLSQTGRIPVEIERVEPVLSSGEK